MAYEITGLSQVEVPPDIDGVYDNPKSANSDLRHLRRKFPGKNFDILRDGLKLTDAELDADIKSFEIQAVIEKSTQLPATYRPGRGTESDDVATGIDGNPVNVRGPDNPEDRYD